MNAISGQSGIPTKERACKSRSGFEVRQLAAGFSHDGGVVQSRERTMLTNPALMRDKLDELLGRERENPKLPSLIHSLGTSSDHAIEGHSKVFWMYAKTHMNVMAGKVNISKYGDSSNSSDIHKLPLSDHEFLQRHFYAYAQQHLPDVIRDFLGWVVLHDNPDLSENSAISRGEIGGILVIGKKGQPARDVADGALSICVRVLSEMHKDFDIWFKRHRQHIAKVEFLNKGRLPAAR